MKIRNGFVSNSSSSSFLIYGCEIKIPSKCEDEYIYIEELDETINKKGLSLVIEPLYEEYFVGISWDEVGNKETGGQFKLRVEKEITELFGKKKKCRTIKSNE